MKQNITMIALFLGLAFASQAQTAPKPTLYHPEADARAEIDAAVKKAGGEGKHVMLQLGGNWCVWCLRFNDLVKGNDTLQTYLTRNFEVVHVNYSAENKNEAVLASLDFPQRFGFPVFVVLDGNGKRIHTQNSAYLEEGKGHNSKKVLEFFRNWSPDAVNPKSYAKSTPK